MVYYLGPSMSLFKQTVRPMKLKQSANQIYARMINITKRKTWLNNFFGRGLGCFRLIVSSGVWRQSPHIFHNNNNMIFTLNRNKFHT